MVFWSYLWYKKGRVAPFYTINIRQNTIHESSLSTDNKTHWGPSAIGGLTGVKVCYVVSKSRIFVLLCQCSRRKKTALFVYKIVVYTDVYMYTSQSFKAILIKIKSVTLGVTIIDPPKLVV